MRQIKCKGITSLSDILFVLIVNTLFLPLDICNLLKQFKISSIKMLIKSKINRQEAIA